MWIIHARKIFLFPFFRASRGYGVNGLGDKKFLLGAIFSSFGGKECDSQNTRNYRIIKSRKLRTKFNFQKLNGR